MAHAHIGVAKYVMGRAEETEAHVEEALRLSPRDVYASTWLDFAGVAKLALGRDEEAAARLYRSVEIFSGSSSAPERRSSVAGPAAQPAD